MTPCSAELCCLNILSRFHSHAFDVKPPLVRFLLLFFLWVILNSTSLQSLWCVTNSPPPPLLTSLIPFSAVIPPSTWQSLLPLFFLSVSFFPFVDIFFLLIFPLLLSLSPPFFSLGPNPSPLPVSVPAVKDISVQLSQIMFACPAVKTGGCPFHSTSHTTKGDGREEGFNARVWTQAIISNYCFSFQFSCPDGGLTRRTCNNLLQSSRISGPSESVLSPGTPWLSSQCESGVDSNMEWWEN